MTNKNIMEAMGSTNTKETNDEVIVKEHNQRGPSYFYFREDKKQGLNRIITVCYMFNEETNDLTYGASIYKKDKIKDTFVKRKHRETAMSRFTKYPITVQMDKSKLFKAKEWQINIRKLLFTNGVCQKNHNQS